jgi:hypothetical protein
MNTKNPSETVLAFYDSLHTLITSKKFDKVIAAALVATFNEMTEHISLDECTVDSLKAAHKQYNDPSADLDYITAYSEKAFADLAPQLRNPRAQEICERFRGNSGTGDATDLYVQVRNFRLLGVDEAGAAIVTLAVDSYSTLIDLLEKCDNSACEYTHFSHSKKTTPV